MFTSKGLATLFPQVPVCFQQFERVQIERDLPPLPAAVEVAAYRIVLEALTNVARHSGATRAMVALYVGDDTLAIVISDNGVAGGEWAPGIGMTSMRERAGELGGTVTFRTTPTGSTVTVRLPLGTPDAAEGFAAST